MEMYYFTIASNFMFGFDKYKKRYSKSGVQAKFEDKFFLLFPYQFEIGYEKALSILSRHGKRGDFVVAIKVDNHLPLCSDHETGVGQYVKSSFVKVNSVYSVSNSGIDVILNEMRIEDLLSRSYAINSSDDLDYLSCKPRTVSVLPVAIGCQAKCTFCYSKYSVSSDIENGKFDLENINQYFDLAKESGAERAVITGGGEPTLIPHHRLSAIIKSAASKFGEKVLMITNGYKYAQMSELEIEKILWDLKASGLGTLAISHHHYDGVKNTNIMNLEISIEKVLTVWKKYHKIYDFPKLRLICVLQKDGINSQEEIERYIQWAKGFAVPEICFKELYVSATIESEYSSYGYNDWSYENQVSLDTVVDVLDSGYLGFERVSELPWGSPVYSNGDIQVAAYTEPSVGWELRNKTCRSWNIMASGECLASLEYMNSKIELKETLNGF